MKNEMQGDDVGQMDKQLRQFVAEYFFMLDKMGDPNKAIQMLADHVTIMVEMINELKAKMK